MIKRAVNIWDGITEWSRDIQLPLFHGLSLYDVAHFFFKGIAKGRITDRAASISFSFFLALFPGIIFLFSLIAFFPIQDLQEEVFEVFRRILPPDTYKATRSTIDDILQNKRPDLLSFGFFFALIFATNGIQSLISNFNQSIHQFETRNFWQQQLVAVGLTITLSVVFIIGIILIIFSADVLNSFLAFLGWEEISPASIEISRFLLLLFLVFTTIALIYNIGPSRNRGWKFFSPGAILATLLIVVSSLAFSLYISNFSQYNKLYGSIGTLLVILLWIYINSLVLLIGFELNAGIASARLSTAKDRQAELEKNL